MVSDLFENYEFGVSNPVPLTSDALRDNFSFVYDRKYGVFACESGTHQVLMAHLLASHHGCRSWLDVAEKLNLKSIGQVADAFLKGKGRAFLSSVSFKVAAWNAECLDDWEVAYFNTAGGVRFINDD